VSTDRPLARSDGLITEELDGELLVYDSENNLAHALDADAAAVWRACDGHTDTHTLATRCQTSEGDVRMTLARLGELGLLEVAQAGADGDTRRSALRKIGIAGVGVATISSILVPIAAAAGSCAPPGNCISNGQSCCTGYAKGGLGCPDEAPGLCCLPAGVCSTYAPPANPCCSGELTLDFSCPSSPFGRPGFRCT
jgi:hypothetical protein